MYSRSWNACFLCALASLPASAGVSREVGAPTVVAIANGYAISNSIPVTDRTSHRFFALPVRIGSQAFPSIPGDFGESDRPISAPLARWSPGGSNVACTASSTWHTGTIVLIERGSCSFSTKIRNAQMAGAAGVVIIDNQPGGPSVMAQDGTAGQPTLPAVMVSQQDGAAIKKCAGLAASIAGPAPASFPARVVAASGSGLYNPMNLGGGVLALAAATSPSAEVDPATYTFPKAEPVSGGARTISVTVKNPTGATRTYAASVSLAALANEDASAASVTVEPSSLTLAPGQSAELSVTVDTGQAPQVAPYWGKLTVVPDAGSALAAPFWFAVRTYTDAVPLQ